MNYLDYSIDEFATYIRDKKKRIVLFGAGTICRVFIPQIVREHGLLDEIAYIVDNNTSKQGTVFEIFGRKIPIVASDILLKDKKDYCILITNGDFYSVVSQLESIIKNTPIDVFIAAYMLYPNKKENLANEVFVDDVHPQIPRIIHYCWFSGTPIPNDLQACIDSWRRECPDYEIIRWDESNVDLDKYQYTREAYRMKKWGFIPDVIRLDILYEYGGFYFDTDVRIIKNLDQLRYQEAFCGRERAGHVNFGGGSGCIKCAPVIKEILDFRKDCVFDLGNGQFNNESSGYYETVPLIEKGLVLKDINQKLDGINVYASEFFSPYNFVNGENIRSDNTFSIHYFSGSWLSDGDKQRAETRNNYYEFRNQMERR